MDVLIKGNITPDAEDNCNMFTRAVPWYTLRSPIYSKLLYNIITGSGILFKA